MASIEYNVAGQQIAVTKDAELVENTVGVYDVKFTFDSSWSSFTDKTAVFVSDTHPDAPYEVPLDANSEALIPAAVLKYGNLMIGVYGSTQTQQYPTVWAPPKRVWPGAGPGIEPPADPVFGMVVRTAPQELTSEQQSNARTNIGAAGSSEMTTALAGKMDKDTDGVAGNVAAIDTNGNIKDGGIASSDILQGTRFADGTQEIDSTIDFPYTGLLKNSNGVVQTSETSYKTTDFIDLTDLYGIYRTGTTVQYTLWRYSFYDADEVFLGTHEDTNTYDIVSYNGQQVTWLDLSGYQTAKYVRISWQTSRPYTYHKVSLVPRYGYNIPYITIKSVNPLKFYKKKIVNFGDSLFGNFRDTNDTTDKSISKMIADATGAIAYNCGFGGCRMAYHSDKWRAFSMYALADAITTGVWTAQDSAVANPPTGMPSYFSDTLALLKSIDFDEIDYITIGYGTNDYAGNVFINSTDATFTEPYEYFKGALAYSLEKILTTYPHIKVIVITPCWRWFLTDGEYAYSSDDSESINTRGYYLYDYVDAIVDICNKYHVSYVDTYYTLGLNEYTHLTYFPSTDGTHLNQLGRQLRADRIVGQMQSLF